MSGATPVIKSSMMPSDMQKKAIDIAIEALTKEQTHTDVAAHIRSKFVEHYGGAPWHCFVGRNFGCFVTHERSKFIYFYVGQIGICLFASA